MDQFPPMPSNGQCICGRVPFFVRSGVIGPAWALPLPEVWAPLQLQRTALGARACTGDRAVSAARRLTSGTAQVWATKPVTVPVV